ncbi:hypothetical protein CMO91_05090 [Candidatus Woesearchaeota archaeon]|nr:hypothetical protein [Candidatus Woesearchaeota archaeon]
MDIEKAKKVNSLARELQQGFSLTNDEAFRQARAVFNEPPNIHPQQPHVPVATEEDVEESPELQQAVDSQRYFQEINTLRNDVATLSAEVVNLRSELERIKLAPSPEPPVPEPAPVPDTPPPEPEPIPEPAQPDDPAPVEEKEVKEHPRSGGYRPEDVAIDKMFYFGSK